MSYERQLNAKLLINEIQGALNLKRRLITANGVSVGHFSDLRNTLPMVQFPPSHTFTQSPSFENFDEVLSILDASLEANTQRLFSEFSDLPETQAFLYEGVSVEGLFDKLFKSDPEKLGDFIKRANGIVNGRAFGESAPMFRFYNPDDKVVQYMHRKKVALFDIVKELKVDHDVWRVLTKGLIQINQELKKVIEGKDPDGKPFVDLLKQLSGKQLLNGRGFKTFTSEDFIKLQKSSTKTHANNLFSKTSRVLALTALLLLPFAVPAVFKMNLEKRKYNEKFNQQNNGGDVREIFIVSLGLLTYMNAAIEKTNQLLGQIKSKGALASPGVVDKVKSARTLTGIANTIATDFLRFAVTLSRRYQL